MKILYIMRHGEKDTSKGYPHDYDVELTQKGIEDIKSVSSKYKQKNKVPDLIVSSPAIRAKQTSQIVCEIIKYNNSVMYNEVIYQAFLNEIIESITYTFDTIDSLMLIGHNPSLTALCLTLGGEKEELGMAHIAKFEFDCDSWTEISKENAKYIETIKP